MLYFKDLFNKFCLKISNSKLFKFFFGCVFLFFFIPKVNASELLFGSNGNINIYNGTTVYVKVEDSSNNLPKTIYGLTANGGSINMGVLDLNISPASAGISVLDSFTYNYLIFDTCLTSSMVKFSVSNSSCGTSCVATGTYSSVSTGEACVVNNISGTRYIYQIPVQKWNLNEYSEQYEVSSYLTVRNDATFSVALVIKNAFLSNEDFTLVYKNQTELINKLNSVQSAITNMQNSINSNANTNTQNIINNQNSNTNAINGNIDQEFSDLKNYDHTYNNNSADTPSNQSDITSVLSQQNTLSSSIDLDSSILDVTLNTDATTWIWGVVDNFRTINGKITLLFTTILSLAVIKMILNR